MPKIGYARLTADGGIRTDGSGGKVGSIGAVLRTSRGHLIGSISEKLGPVPHHNVCEYRAVIRGLQLAQQEKIRDLRVFLDSTLVVEQLCKRSKVRADDLKPLYDEAMRLVESFGWGIRISWIPREWNGEADLLANLALAD